MIFVWAGDGGGPLQYIGVVIFFLQFLAPHFFSLSIQIIHYGAIKFPPALVMLLALVGFGAGLLTVVHGVSALLRWMSQLDENQAARAQADTSNSNNATVLDEDEPTAATAAADNRATFRRAWNRTRSFARSLSPTHKILGFLTPLAVATPLFISGMQHSPNGVVNDSQWLTATVLAIAHLFMVLAAYRILRDVINFVNLYPGNRRRERTAGRKWTVQEIADLLRKVPAEEFVSEDDVKVCSVTKLKRMLINRGEGEAAARCLETDDLAKEIGKVRHFDSECAICAEQFVEG